jgi:metacaspase-1
MDGDEDDGNDEVIYPMDHDAAGHIVDDDMWEIMVRSLPIGCRLTVCVFFLWFSANLLIICK